MKTTRLQNGLALATFALFLTVLEPNQAATVSWTNTAGGNWSTAANWSGGVLPTAADDVLITAAGTYTVTQDVHATVASVTLGGASGRQHLTNVAAVLAVTGASAILNNGVLGLNGGQLNGPGAYSVTGTLHWPSGVLNAPIKVAANGLLELVGTADKAFYHNVTNHGSIRWSGAHNLYLVGVGILNAGDGTFEARNDQVLLWSGGEPRLFNAGLLRKSGSSGTTTFLNVPLINTGTVEVQGGILNHSAGSQFLSGTVLTGAGTNLLAAGTVLFDGSIHSDNAELAAGGLIGTNTLLGSFRWTGGVLGNICNLTVAADSTLEIAGTAERRLEGVLRNEGTITWTGANTFYVAYGVIDNQAGGLFDVRNDQVMAWAGGSPLFLNAGLLRKSAGVGVSTLANVPLLNRGTVEAQAGIFNHSQGSQFLGGTVLTGAGINLLASGVVLFDGAIHSDNAELAAGGLIGTNTLTGTLRWAGGIIGNNCVMTVASNATVQISGTAERRLEGYLVNRGHIEWTGSNTFYVAYGAIDNQAGGLFEVRNNQVMAWAGGSPGFYNSGLLRKSASTGMTTFDRVVLVNRGTVEAQTGILNHSLNSQFLDGTLLTGAGTNLLASGTMLFDGTIHSDNTELAAGGLIGTNTLTGTLRWSGGVIGNNCVMTVASNATVQISGAAERRLEGYLVNRGRIEWTGSNTFHVAYGGLQNLAGGIFDVQNNQVMAWAGGSPFFINAGVFRKSGGTGLTDLSGVSFQNTGTVDAQSGIIRFLSAYAQTGGRLQFGLSGLTNFGQIQFAQPAPLAGTLAANLLGGFRPKTGDVFTVISYFPSSTGGFTAFDLPNEAAWQTNSSIYGANTVTLTVLNARPGIEPIADKTTDELVSLSFSITASDPDSGNSLSYALVNPPENASINASSGLFSWTPSEVQGPSTNAVTVRVTDNGTPGLSSTNTFTIVVREVNRRPVPTTLGSFFPNELTPFSLTAPLATDPDVPANTLRFELRDAPAGMVIHPDTGAIVWTPTEAQGPSLNTIVVRITDNGSPPLSATNSFIVHVAEVNVAPELAAPGDQIVVPGSMLVLTNQASDVDLPANTLSFSLIEHPSGAGIEPGTGRMTWTTRSGDAGTTNRFSVVVRDNGVPILGATQSFSAFVLPLPRLAISRNVHTVTLSWPAVYAGFGLQNATSLNPPPVWVDLTNLVTLVGTNRVVITPATERAEYFRLTHP
jgi:hypothetical protein